MENWRSRHTDVFIMQYQSRCRDFMCVYQRSERYPAFVRDTRPDIDVTHREELARHPLEQRRSPCVHTSFQTRSPGEQQQIPVIGIVIGVLMRHENVTQPGKRHTCEDELTSHAITAVHDIRYVIDNNDLSRGRCGFLWPRSTTCSE